MGFQLLQHLRSHSPVSPGPSESRVHVSPWSLFCRHGFKEPQREGVRWAGKGWCSCFRLPLRALIQPMLQIVPSVKHNPGRSVQFT